MTPAGILFLIITVGVIIWLIGRTYNNAGEIDRNLLAACKGNRGLAKRLLAQARERNPGKSDRWYVEKVLYDLERDGAGGRGRRGHWSMSQREMRETFFMVTIFASMLSMLSSLINQIFRGR